MRIRHPRKHLPVTKSASLLPDQTQMEANRKLTILTGKTVNTVQLVTLEGGILPDGDPYDGTAMLLEMETCGTRLLVVPNEHYLRWFLVAHESELPKEDPTITALHACDWLESECRRNHSDCSRFRGKSSTVYVALTNLAQNALNRAYEELNLDGLPTAPPAAP